MGDSEVRGPWLPEELMLRHPKAYEFVTGRSSEKRPTWRALGRWERFLRHARKHGVDEALEKFRYKEK